jgi:hypothetical protein
MKKRVADERPILVADDEDSYRRAVAQMLTRAAPVCAMNGEGSSDDATQFECGSDIHW